MKLSKSDIDTILKNFDLPESLSFTELGGSANKNFLVRVSDSREYVVKLLILHKKEMLVNDIAIQIQLHEAQLVTPRYIINTKGTWVYENGNIQAVVSEKIQGIHCKKLNGAMCFEFGKKLALFHISVRRLPKTNKGWMNLKTAKRLLQLDSGLEYVQTARSLIKRNMFIYLEGLPQGFIHGDFHENNVLIESEQKPVITSVMDFEESEANLFIVDIARTILSVCRDKKGTGLMSEKIRCVVEGYETLRRLESREKELLANAIKYASGLEVIWLYMHGFVKEAEEHIERARITYRTKVPRYTTLI